VIELRYVTDGQPAVGDTGSQIESVGRTTRLYLQSFGVENRHRRTELRIVLIFLFYFNYKLININI